MRSAAKARKRRGKGEERDVMGWAEGVVGGRGGEGRRKGALKWRSAREGGGACERIMRQRGRRGYGGEKEGHGVGDGERGRGGRVRRVRGRAGGGRGSG